MWQKYNRFKPGNGYLTRYPLKFMLRGYIEEVAKIHGLFRAKTESLFNDILDTLRKTEREMFPDAENPIEVQLIKLATENNDREKYNIGYEYHSVLKDRRQEWQSLGSEQKRYYSSAIISEDKKYPREDKKLWITE